VKLTNLSQTMTARLHYVRSTQSHHNIGHLPCRTDCRRPPSGGLHRVLFAVRMSIGVLALHSITCEWFRGAPQPLPLSSLPALGVLDDVQGWQSNAMALCGLPLRHYLWRLFTGLLADSSNQMHPADAAVRVCEGEVRLQCGHSPFLTTHRYGCS
jgi:hypothetical protein